ncbi:MAG: hypothetical protein HKL82_09130 [Acidimicrobiaceae bacterium]|nr:hypothetical protein [Acidimicrobiaceae bacterium]
MTVVMIIAAVISLGAAVVSLVTALTTRRVARNLLEQQRILRAESFELAAEAKRAMESASIGAERAEDLLQIAQAANSSIERTSKVARRVVTYPSIRIRSAVVGFSSARRTLFGRGSRN